MQKRISSFVWLLGHDRLLPNHQKSIKGIRGVNCKLYGYVCEYTLHVFRDCPKARQIWSNIIPGNIKHDFFTVELKD